MWVPPALRFLFRAVGHSETKGILEMDEKRKKEKEKWVAHSKNLTFSILDAFDETEGIEADIKIILHRISIIKNKLDPCAHLRAAKTSDNAYLCGGKR